jgi:hypothetical protein
VRDTAPKDPNASSVGGYWYINANRTIWVSVPQVGWPAGGTLYSGNGQAKGQKTYWVKPYGSTLTIHGKRLDAAAPPVGAGIPCCYPTGFQIVALHFLTEGCWEVTATAEGEELRFVTRVHLESTASR